MSNRRKPTAKTIPSGPGSTPGCPCCSSLGLPTLQRAVPADVMADCCTPCQLALTLGQSLHPHAVPHLHWHQPPGRDGFQPGELCPADGLVNATCVIDDHRDHALLEQGRSATHDVLVDGLGGLRASGVWWTQHVGDDALDKVERLWPSDEDLEPRVREIRKLTLEHLEAEHAMLIVAWCVGLDPSLAPT